MPTLHRELTQKTLKPGSSRSVENGKSKLRSKNVKEHKNMVGGDNIVPLSKIASFPGPGPPKDDPVICKLEPFNICYRFDEDGNMHPLGARRPVRLIRIYK